MQPSETNLGVKSVFRGTLLALCGTEELGNSIRQIGCGTRGGRGVGSLELFGCYLVFRPGCQNETFRCVSRTVILSIDWSRCTFSVWHMLLDLPGQLWDILPSAIAPCRVQEVQIALTFVWLVELSESKPQSPQICRESTLCKSTYAHYWSSITMLHAHDKNICSNDVDWLKDGALQCASVRGTRNGPP